MKVTDSHTALIDILSNTAGMMILIACLSLLLDGKQNRDVSDTRVKPIRYPLPYLNQKQSVNLLIKDGYLYEMPMESMVRQLRNGSEKGVAQQDVIVEANGVRGLIRADAGDTGFIFLFKVIGKSDSPCSNSWALKKKLDSMATRYPAEQFFFKFKVWNNPEDFQAISDIRKYLTDKGYEVGWIPHSSREDDEVDLILGVGIYNESFSSIKAQ